LGERYQGISRHVASLWLTLILGAFVADAIVGWRMFLEFRALRGLRGARAV